jgi:hypothetical protein
MRPIEQRAHLAHSTRSNRVTIDRPICRLGSDGFSAARGSRRTAFQYSLGKPRVRTKIVAPERS